MIKSDKKKQLSLLVEDVGFAEIIFSLGELAKKEESIIESKNNSVLFSCFEMTLLMLIEAYPKTSKKHQKFIRQVLTGEHFGEGLKLIKWDSPMQSEGMKEAYALVNSWKVVDKAEC